MGSPPGQLQKYSLPEDLPPEGPVLWGFRLFVRREQPATSAYGMAVSSEVRRENPICCCSGRQ